MLSIAKTEHIALGSATQEASLLHQLLDDLKIDNKGSIKSWKIIKVYAIAWAKSSAGYKRTKILTSSIILLDRKTVQTEFSLSYNNSYTAEQLLCFHQTVTKNTV